MYSVHDPPIFDGDVPRSGTTFLHGLLGCYSPVLGVPEARFEVTWSEGHQASALNSAGIPYFEASAGGVHEFLDYDPVVGVQTERLMSSAQARL